MSSPKPVYHFVPNEAALLINGNLVVADLHNGIEHAQFKKGVRIESDTKKKLARIKKLLERTKPEKLIILGDLKHNVPVTSKQEQMEIPGFLSELKRCVDDVIITKGNHDGGIERLIPPGIVLTDEFIECGIGYFHGHKKASEDLLSQQIIVCAHTHPSIVLKDIRKDLRQVWAEGPLKNRGGKVIIVPAFDELAKGSPLNLSEPLGNFLKNEVELGSLELYLSDGSYLGSLEDLAEA